MTKTGSVGAVNFGFLSRERGRERMRIAHRVVVVAHNRGQHIDEAVDVGRHHDVLGSCLNGTHRIGAVVIRYETAYFWHGLTWNAATSSHTAEVPKMTIFVFALKKRCAVSTTPWLVKAVPRLWTTKSESLTLNRC